MLFSANRTRVSSDLANITRVGAEAAPAAGGLTPRRVQRLSDAFETLYRTGLHPGMVLTVRRNGERVFHRALGHASGNGPGDRRRRGGDAATVPMEVDTPVCLFSASKAVTAMLAHKMIEEGRFKATDRVVQYIPEYGQAGKSETTIGHLMAHRAGIPGVPVDNPDPALLYDWDGVIQMLCAAKPMGVVGAQQAYHAITAGYIVGELIRRVTGQELNAVLRERFTGPLGLDSLSYGYRATHGPAPALNYFTGSALPPGIHQLARRALGIDFERVPEVSNSPEFMSSVIPAGNMYASADDICLFYEMLRRGGELNGVRVLKAETVEAARKPAGPIRLDRTLVVPVRFSEGFILGEWPASLFGINTPRAFGHLGYINIVTWADPQRRLSAALLTTGKPFALDGWLRFAQMMTTVAAVCPTDG